MSESLIRVGFRENFLGQGELETASREGFPIRKRGMMQ